MRLRNIIAVLLLAAAIMAVRAAIPSGYYQKLDGLATPAGLKTAVHDIISPHSVPQNASGYNAVYTSLPGSYFIYTDVYPDGSGRWWDMYSDIRFMTPSFRGLNREHSFPKSWWGSDKSTPPNTQVPPYVDLNHLYPAEAVANQAKSNYPLGKVSATEKIHFDNGVSKVGYPVAGQGGSAKFVFEPADEYKGDFARTYFYMVTCYQDMTWNRSYMYMLEQNTWPTLQGWASSLLLQWSHDDPVSQKEIDRNNEVYRLQNNRNPFIDLPGLEQYIWGDKQGQPYKLDLSGQPVTNDPELYSPVEGMALEFGQCAVGSGLDRKLLISGANLKGNLSLRLTGADKAHFALTETTVSADVANSSAGYYVTVRYLPKAIGKHMANVTVFDGGLRGSYNVALHGEALAIPRLQPVKALPASDVTATSYVANWETPAEVVDYYVVNRTRYMAGASVTDQLTAEENSLLIDDYNPDIEESYTVQSVRLDYYSDPSNVIVVGQNSIQGVVQNQPLVVESYPEGLRIVCGEPHTGLRVYDLAGRLVVFEPQAFRNQELILPAGAYLIVTDQHPRAVKAFVRY